MSPPPCSDGESCCLLGLWQCTGYATSLARASAAPPLRPPDVAAPSGRELLLLASPLITGPTPCPLASSESSTTWLALESLRRIRSCHGPTAEVRVGWLESILNFVDSDFAA